MYILFLRYFGIGHSEIFDPSVILLFQIKTKIKLYPSVLHCLLFLCKAFSCVNYHAIGDVDLDMNTYNVDMRLPPIKL